MSLRFSFPPHLSAHPANALRSIAIENSEVGVSVVCTSCYFTAHATAELLVRDDGNLTASISSLVTRFASDVRNLTSTIVDEFIDTFGDDAIDLFHLDLDGLEWPTIDADFSLVAADAHAGAADIALPSFQFQLTVNAFEVYLQLHTNIAGSATYTVNLYTSETVVGIRLGNGLEFGVVLTVDLIMNVDGGVVMDSGFHLRMDEALSLTVDLFANSVSDIVL